MRPVAPRGSGGRFLPRRSHLVEGRAAASAAGGQEERGAHDDGPRRAHARSLPATTGADIGSVYGRVAGGNVRSASERPRYAARQHDDRAVRLRYDPARHPAEHDRADRPVAARAAHEQVEALRCQQRRRGVLREGIDLDGHVPFESATALRAAVSARPCSPSTSSKSLPRRPAVRGSVWRAPRSPPVPRSGRAASRPTGGPAHGRRAAPRGPRPCRRRRRRSSSARRLPASRAGPPRSGTAHRASGAAPWSRAAGGRPSPAGCSRSPAGRHPAPPRARATPEARSVLSTSRNSAATPWVCRTSLELHERLGGIGEELLAHLPGGKPVGADAVHRHDRQRGAREARRGDAELHRSLVARDRVVADEDGLAHLRATLSGRACPVPP